MSAPATWQYWFPDRGETRDNARTGPRIGDLSASVYAVAKAIAEQQWHNDSPDYWDNITVCLARFDSPTVYTAEVEVEHCPYFRTSSVKESQ